MARRMLLAIGACAALFYALRTARASLFAVEVSGESMLPALAPGDFVLVRRRLPKSPGGRIVHLRRAGGRPLLKRLVGFPGDSLRVGEHVVVNGRTLIEPYVRGASPLQQFRGVNRLAPDEYFVLGDNRAASTDSRDFGPVHVSDIEGVAWFRYWPLGRLGRLTPASRRFDDAAARRDADADASSATEGGRLPLRDGIQFGTTS